MTPNERIKELRKSLKLSQEQFGESLGLTKSGISNIENGSRNVTDKHIKLLSVAFHANENWIRTGEGAMFYEVADTYIDHLVEEHHLDQVDKQILQSYLELEPSQRQVIKEYILKIAASLAVEREVSPSIGTAPANQETAKPDTIAVYSQPPDLIQPQEQEDGSIRVWAASNSDPRKGKGYTGIGYKKISKDLFQKIKDEPKTDDKF